MKPKQNVCKSTAMITLALSMIFFSGCKKDVETAAAEAQLANDAAISDSSLTGTISTLAARNTAALLVQSPFEASGFISGWSNEQHCCSYSITASTSIKRAGSQSIRFELNSSDAIVSGSKRSEITQNTEAETIERWYGGSFYLETYASDPGAESILQWHDVDGTTPPLSLQIASGKLRVTQSFTSGNTYHDLGAYTTGKWVDIVMHVKWTTASNGLLEVWKDGVKVITQTGRTNSSRGSYLKLGINKWSWAPGGGTSTSTKRVMYWDEFRIGNQSATYDDVAPTGGTTTTPPPVSNVLPVVTAGSAQTITLPVSTVTLNGNATDADGTVASYSWSKVSGGNAVIVSATAKTTVITGLTQGTYVFKLTATDNKGGVGSSNITITINSQATTPPATGVRKNLLIETTSENTSNWLTGWSNGTYAGSYSVTNSATVARAGSRSTKFDVRKTDPVSGGTVGAEFSRPTDPETIERWYGVSYYLADYQSDNGGESLLQWHDVDNSMPPLSLQVWGTNLVVMQSINGANTQNAIGTWTANKWIDLVFHVKWTTSNSGILEVWKDGVKVVSKTGIRTASTGGNYFKIGLNKWSWAPGGGTSRVTSRVFYADEIRIGSELATYADVKPGN